MPLSDHEQKLLEQMERALYAEDPKFATQMKGTAARRAGRRRLIGGILVAVLGLVLVVVGVTTELILVGGLGFAVMVAGVAWALTPPRQTPTAVPSTSPPTKVTSGAGKAKRRSRRSGTLMQRLEERWERRRRNGQW